MKRRLRTGVLPGLGGVRNAPPQLPFTGYSAAGDPGLHRPQSYAAHRARTTCAAEWRQDDHAPPARALAGPDGDVALGEGADGAALRAQRLFISGRSGLLVGG